MGLWLVIGSFFLLALAHFVRTLIDVWLVRWAHDEGAALPSNQRLWWILTTSIFIGLVFLLLLIQGVIALYFWLDASDHIFKRAIHNVFNSTIAYLDQTPIGSIINKICGKDVETLDSQIPSTFLGFCPCCSVWLPLSSSPSLLLGFSYFP
jgi:ABC-type multidrug transport system fused ATPase/permease subunit